MVWDVWNKITWGYRFNNIIKENVVKQHFWSSCNAIWKNIIGKKLFGYILSRNYAVGLAFHSSKDRHENPTINRLICSQMKSFLRYEKWIDN